MLSAATATVLVVRYSGIPNSSTIIFSESRHLNRRCSTTGSVQGASCPTCSISSDNQGQSACLVSLTLGHARRGSWCCGGHEWNLECSTDKFVPLYRSSINLRQNLKGLGSSSFLDNSHSAGSQLSKAPRDASRYDHDSCVPGLWWQADKPLSSRGNRRCKIIKAINRWRLAPNFCLCPSPTRDASSSTTTKTDTDTSTTNYNPNPNPTTTATATAHHHDNNKNKSKSCSGSGKSKKNRHSYMRQLSCGPDRCEPVLDLRSEITIEKVQHLWYFDAKPPRLLHPVWNNDNMRSSYFPTKLKVLHNRAAPHSFATRGDEPAPKGG